MSREPPYEIIRDGLVRGKVVPFLGAGASLDLRPPGASWRSPKDPFLPTATELAEYLDRRSGFPQEEIVELPRVAQYVDGVTGREGLNEELHQIFAQAYQPTALHRFFASLPSNLLIVTTNYDDLVERAYTERNRPFDLVIYDTAKETVRYQPHGSQDIEEVLPNEFMPDLGNVTVIFKMHGTFDREDSERGSYVITEEDYVEFLARMSQTKAIPAAFAESFKKSHFLFLGYGLRDWNLRVILHRIWKDRPHGRNSWAIQHQASELEREFWLKRKLTIFEMTIDEFLEKLQQTFEPV